MDYGGVVNASEFDFSIFQNLPVQKKGQGHRTYDKKQYRDIICAFDIETTRIDEIEQAVMYIWQFQVGTYCTVIGRTWDEFLTFVQRIKQAIKDDYIVVYVHNLSYEIQFLQGIYDFQPDDIFCIKPRVVLKAIMSCLELRCSYKLSNMSLDEYCTKMGVEHKKVEGFDYSKKRYPWTELTREEMLYCINDVRGLVEAVKVEMDAEHDNLYTIPLTSTGYIRREAKEAMRHYPRKELKDGLPGFDVYTLLRRAFRGGDTHANRFFAGDLLDGPIYSYDRASSYPHVQMVYRFPMGVFRPMKSEIMGTADALDYVIDLMDRRNKACLVDIAIWDYGLKERYWPAPPLMSHKCREYNPKITVIDNGRVLRCDYLETTVTDIDLRILLETTCEKTTIIPLKGYYTHYGYLPSSFRALIMKYFKAKCELKGVKGQEVYYVKSKNKLNSFYGLTAQSPVRQSVKFFLGMYLRRYDLDDSERKQKILDDLGIPEIEDEIIDELLKPDNQLLEAYNKKAYLPYQWGVWTTAWARWELYQMQRTVFDAGGDLLYWDTDSVKFRGNVDFTGYNKRITKQAKEREAIITYNNKDYILGFAEYEGCYSKFITHGAKKYCRIEESKQKIPTCIFDENTDIKILECVPRLVLTCAGVGKKSGASEILQSGGIETFQDGFVFHEAGGLEAKYNNNPFGHYVIDGHELNITRNVCLVPSTYTLGKKGDYVRILEEAKNILSNSDIMT